MAIAVVLTQGICLVAVSDGYFKTEFGTASWIMQADHAAGDWETGELHSSCVSPGQPSDQSPYRSKLSGLFSIITIMDTVCQYHGIDMGRIELACDGLSALEQATYDSDIVNPKFPQFNLVLAICKAMQHSPLEWTFCHIKGHQDNHHVVLDHWEKLNVQMDAEAKRYWANKVDEERPVQQRVRGEPWSLWQGDIKICNDF